MIDQADPAASTEPVEATLRDALARGDAVAGSVAPVLRHLIVAGDVTVFSEEILTRVRAMLASLAVELLDALVGSHVRRTHTAGEIEVMSGALLDNPALLAHLHALALEWQLTERIEARLAVDPVMSPLLQALVSSPDAAVRAGAAAFLAAQARWCQAQRRMTLPLTELPADLLNVALYTLTMLAGAEPGLAERATLVETAIRSAYQDGATRLGLAASLVTNLGEGAGEALAIAHGGVPLFLTVLAQRSAQPRDAVVLGTHETQLARLALALRAAGLSPGAVGAQVTALHPQAVLPQGFESLDADRAAALLSGYRR